MKDRTTLQKVIPAAVSVAFLAACLLLVGMIHRTPGLTRYAHASYAFFILQPDSVEEEDVQEYAGVCRTYTFTVPEDSAASTGAYIMFYLRHTVARLSIDGSDLVYDSGELDTPHIGHTPGNYWVSVPVRPVYAGKTLHITLTPVFESVRNETPSVFLIGHEQLLTMMLIPQDTLMLVLCAIAAFTGCFLFLLAVFMPLQGDDRRRLILLGAVALTASIWKLTGLSSVSLMLDTRGIHKELWYLGAVMYMATLLLSLRFLLYLRERGNGRVGNICYGLLLSCAFVLVILQFFNCIELHQVLVGYGIAAAVLHLIVLFEQAPAKRELLWGLPFLLTLGIDLLILVGKGSLHTAPFFMLWIIANLFILGFGFVRAAILHERLLREKEVELRAAKINSMIQQIRPHFIYNTLSSIYVLCQDNPKLAMQVIQDFTAYLQDNFTAISTTKPIPFHQELRHTKSYLAVEALRYGERLNVDFDTPHTAFRLPALTLQPIVENAVKHSLGTGPHTTVHIVVRTRLAEGSSVITVEDNGPGMDLGRKDQDVHIGLQNVKERLEMTNGGTLTILSEPGAGTKVTIRILQADEAAEQI